MMIAKEFTKKPTARPATGDVRTCAQEIAREYRRKADELEAACNALDPLPEAVDGLAIGRVWSHMLFRTTALDHRDRVRGVGRYARKAVRS